jgi:hypothetical protein
MIPQFGASLTAVNYAPRVITCVPGAINYASSEHLQYSHQS